MAAWLASLSLTGLILWVSAGLLGLTALGLILGYALQRLFARRRVWALGLDRGQTRLEVLGNLLFLAVVIPAFVLVLHLGWLRLSDESSGLWTFVGCFFGFQLYYYPLHRGLHHRAWVRFHRWHHRSRVTTPLSGQSMHPVEAAAWAFGYIGLPALVSQVVALSASGWLAYIAFNVVGNIVGHANFELGTAASRVRAVSLFSPPFVYHALHHARWRGHYGFASSTLDALLGTEFDDWRELHAQIASGRPLTSLKVRGDGA